ncbi:MAG: GntR family transcriptional regulator [Agriterribacter sp.]
MKTDSQAGKAYSELRKKILTNQLRPGIRLKEDLWSKNTGVSRMAVREALTRLLGEGLVVQGTKAGYYIKPMTKEDVVELRELREVLEIGALKMLHKKISAEQIQKLEQICDDFTNMVKLGYFSGACEADMKFHETLIELSGNKKLLTTYRTSHIPLFHQKLAKTQENLNDYEQTDKEHRALVKAIKAKDYSLAEQTLIKHFMRGESAILDLE